MYTDELITQVRNLAQVPDTDEDITDEFILTQAYLGLLERFSQPIITLRNGTWLHSYDFTTTNGVSRYRLPSRSIVQGLEKVECAMGQGIGNANSSQWYLLNVQTNIQATDYEGLAYTGRPAAFTYQGDNIIIFPTPTQDWNIRVWFYLRPSSLVTFEDATTNYQSAVVSVTQVSGDQYDVEFADTVTDGYEDDFDFQYVDGNCEMLAVNVPNALTSPQHRLCTLTPDQAYLLTQGSTDQGSDSVVGMFSTSPTCIIQLPQELCNALVSYVGAVVLAEKGDSEKAQVFSQKAELAIKNIVDVALPRAKGQPSVFKTRSTYLRRRIGRWGWGGGWGQF